ncbi:phage tail sheath family protein [Nonomuraea sp. PA05]|uniref:phage tail sheath C-terminal domain-containing protein n=1 Tax=Nonomuraea sp. PA05 TaxID=2604466 RepID=UPI0011DC1654|nr:phage tail sheath C-terminal domain-containing protein [Nonomuraea sp. PA05]TYB64794.1 phage tail sheath family protein [Nonomuraea sp. PA05]
MSIRTDDALVLGAPGVYYLPEVPQPRAAVERLDVAAFVGIAPRGPAYERVDDVADVAASGREVSHRRSVPVPVESWDEYAELFGEFEGPGLLPDAVAAYFAQGGRRAYIVRVVAAAQDPPGELRPPPGCAAFSVLPGLGLRARNEGCWGNRLLITWSYVTRVLTATVTGRAGATEIVLGPGSAVVPGSVLRLTAARTTGTSGTTGTTTATAAIVVVRLVERRGHAQDAGTDLVAICEPGRPAGPGTTVELVEGRLEVTDPDPRRRRRELFTGLGLSAAHPRYVADVLHRDARLVAPLEGRFGDILPPTSLDLARGTPIPGLVGEDRSDQVTAGDLLDDEDGVRRLADADEVASLVVPDLFALPPLAEPDSSPPAGDPRFRPCQAPPAPSQEPAGGKPRLGGLMLDVSGTDGLAALADRQQRLVDLAEELRVVALLDVPPGIDDATVLRWRSRFSSSFAAAYHPWLRVLGHTATRRLKQIPPSAVAAGIIARCELRQGLARGPANEPAAQVVGLATAVPPGAHDRFHRLGVNVFAMTPDGVRLTGARTLSAEPALDRLTTRRLLLEIERVVLRQLGWTVFEPAGETLRSGVRRHLEQLLGELSDAGAFAGGTPADSWFVTVGEPDATGPGRLVVEVGVAPAAPLEFVLVRVALDATGAGEPQLLLGGAVLPPASFAGAGGGLAQPAPGTGTAVCRA